MGALALAVTLGAACGASPPASHPRAPVPSAIAAEAKQGVVDPELAQLLVDDWDARLRRDPVFGTTVGDHRFDDQIADRSPAARDAARAERRDFLARAHKIAPERLNAEDKLTLALYIEDMESDTDVEVCDLDSWSLGIYGDNPVAQWISLAEDVPLGTPAEGAKYLARVKKIPHDVDVEIAWLEGGLAHGRVTNAETVRRVGEMVKGALAKPAKAWPLAAAALARTTTWPADARATFEAELVATLDHDLRPAYERYQALLAKIAPKARTGNQVGVGALPDGAACYAARIRATLAQKRTPEELHQLGLTEMQKIHGELAELGQQVFGTRDVPTIIKRLREDPALHFKTSEEIEAKANAALTAAKAKVPQWFGTLPKTDCVVRRVPDEEAPFTTIAYYRELRADGTKPGEYYVNVYAPETRPRFEAEVLAFHESIPGHHTQIAIAVEQGALPAFRRYLGLTAFVEGWALYVERLAVEMELYTGPEDRLGMLSFDTWRASRLVVDTGIHAMGWTREQAEKYMLENTPLAPNNISNEVDRYIAWPGQALGYKVGQLEIRALRAAAEKTLGAKFDIKAFHDVVLGAGAVSLPILAQRVQAWAAAQGVPVESSAVSSP